MNEKDIERLRDCEMEKFQRPNAGLDPTGLVVMELLVLGKHSEESLRRSRRSICPRCP